MNADRDSELLREPEVTRLYRFGGAWLRKSRRLTTGPPFIRVGRMVFYRRSDLDAFVAAHTVELNGHRRRGTDGGEAE